jgi:hypothetical protein
MDSLHKRQAVIALSVLATVVCPHVRADRVHRYAAHFDLPIPAEPDSSKGWMDDAVIDVPDHLTISDLDVKINVTHTKVFDLQVFIAGPAGTRLCLNMYDPFTEYFDGENYTQTIFDDEAATPVEQAAPPFTGRFRPRQPYRLSTFDGQDAFGPWRLQIYDAYHADTGQLHHVELIVSAPATPPLVTTLAASRIVHDAVILRGRIDDDGGEPCRYRFHYARLGEARRSPAASCTVYTSWPDPGRCKTAGQQFSEYISGLTPGTYSFQAQAKNSAGVSDWGHVQSFTIERPFGGTGSGTPQDPYIITDINELQQMNNDLDACYALACDIDARAAGTTNHDQGFAPIGNRLECFTGVLRGRGHVIRGLTVDRPCDSCVGLFGQTAGSVICNVGLVDLRVMGGQCVGGLVGLNFGEIQEAYVAGSVQGRENVGGLAGANHGTIVNCYSCAHVGAKPTAQSVGGFVGAIEQGIEQGTVSNCYCVAPVLSCESNPQDTLRWNEGTGPEPAGFAGVCSGCCPDCFWLIEKMRSTSACGLGLTAAQIKQQASFTAWDFDGVWAIIEGTTYPFLRRVRPAVPAEVLCPVVGQCNVVRLADEWEIHPDPPKIRNSKFEIRNSGEAAYTAEPVYAVADGIVRTANGKIKTKKAKLRNPPEADGFFDVLVQHSYWGHVWWSGYEGLGDVRVCPGEQVDSSSIVGYLSLRDEPLRGEPNSDAGCLRFAVYRPDVQIGLAPFDARLVPRRLHPSALSFRAVELAREVVGASYLRGGKGYDFDEARFIDADEIRLDASGLVFWAYNEAQGAVHYQQAHRPHNAVHYDTVAGQYSNNCTAIDRAELMPGDLLFFDTPRRGLHEQTGDRTAVDHVAMYVGDFEYPGGIIEGTYYPPGTYDCVEACDSQLDGRSGVVPRTLRTTKTPAYEDAGLLNDSYFFCAARVVEPTIAAVFYSTGPVDVVLAEPGGSVITREVPEVAARLYYSILDIDEDGRLDDMVTIAAAQPGTYTVGVLEEPGAPPADVFSLTLVIGSEVTMLAENVQIRDIPGQPYEFTLGQ